MFTHTVPRVRSNYGKHTFRFAMTKTWEQTPTKKKHLATTTSKKVQANSG